MKIAIVIIATYIASVLIIRWLERRDLKDGIIEKPFYFLWFCPVLNTSTVIVYACYFILYSIYEITIDNMPSFPRLTKFYNWFLNKDL